MAIFMHAPARVRSAALTLTIASSADKAANLLGAEVNGSPVSFGENPRDRLAETRVRVQSGADRRSADRQRHQSLAGALNSRDRLVELSRPARNHLSQSQRRRVLQMRAADHHDMGKGLRLGVQRVAQLSDGRQQRRL